VAGAIYLADTSVWVVQARHPDARARFETLLGQGRLAACQMTALEYLNNAPDARSYEVLWGAVHGHRWLEVTSAAMTRALGVHRELARGGAHRHVRLPDLIIAATAELAGATVLHYDSDFDRIAAITDQPVKWIVPRGAV
jgi:predicted nucleic acid-binding protein